MDQLFSVLLILHIATGGAGLIAGTIAALVKKGSKPHLISGIVFFWGMLVTSVSALVMSWLPGHENEFLFAVGGFTLYMILTGYRIIVLKRRFKSSARGVSMLDYSITLFGLVFTIILMVQSIQGLVNDKAFSAIPGVFGAICMSYVLLDIKLLVGRTSIKLTWLYSHIVRMMGAMIASYTAFLVVNVQIQQQWILWLLPSVIGGIFIGFFIRKYVVSLKSKVYA